MKSMIAGLKLSRMKQLFNRSMFLGKERQREYQKQLKAGVAEEVRINRYKGPPAKSREKQGKSKSSKKKKSAKKTVNKTAKKTTKKTEKKTGKKTEKKTEKKTAKKTAKRTPSETVSSDDDDGSDTRDGSDDGSSMNEHSEDQSSEEIEQEEVPYEITGEGQKKSKGKNKPAWRVVWVDPFSGQPNYSQPTWELKGQLQADLGDEYQRLVDDFELYASDKKRGQRTRLDKLREPAVPRYTRSKRAQ
jgi:hypothetical protein